jgi:guanine deaminase
VALRGTIAHCLNDPGPHESSDAVEVFHDGLLIIRDGRVEAMGDAARLIPGLPADMVVEDWREHFIVPGFIDAHVHYAQTEMIGAYGGALLEWLERYTFPAEGRYGDASYATVAANGFCDELIRQGTTTAMVYCTVHPESVDAIFEAASARNMRMVAGKVMMDRNCPPSLRDTASGSRAQCETLIRKWHGKDRLGYAVTPRFAPTSTPEQLEVCAQLMELAPELHLQTHVAENLDEVRWVAELFPKARSYLDVYERYGLLGPRSVLGHCLHLNDDDRACMAERNAAMAFCPTSNLFLGSGLFDMDSADRHGNQVALATDVGAGTSLSMLRTMGEAYKVARLSGQSLGPWRLLYLATLGAARALKLDQHIGNFSPGLEADIAILNPKVTPILRQRRIETDNLADPLFALMQLGDDRAVAQTLIAGRAAGD